MTTLASSPSLRTTPKAAAGPGLASPVRVLAGICPKLRRRQRRVVLLILAMVLMSLVDLLCTLTYARTIGMVEMNPLAHKMVAIGNTNQLVLFKLFTIAVSCGACYLGRRYRRMEFCAWVCTAILFMLMLHWMEYNREIPGFTNDIALIALSGDNDRWLRLP